MSKPTSHAMGQQVHLLTRIRNSKFRAWFFWQVTLPALAIFFCWPFAYGLHVQYSFQRSFIGGDLFLLGVLLCIGILIEIREEEKYRATFVDVDPKDTLDKLFHLNLLFALLYILAYLGARKIDMQFDFPVTFTPDPSHPFVMPSAVNGMAFCSLFGGVCAIAWSYFVYRKASNIFLKAQVHELKAANGKS